MITERKDLRIGYYYWITSIENNEVDIGYWNGNSFDACCHYDPLYFSEVTNVHPVPITVGD